LQELFTHPFFFQAEDGIRDRNVTGVQTCALPICWNDEDNESNGGNIWVAGLVIRNLSHRVSNWRSERSLEEEMVAQGIIGIQSEIGRASCRERTQTTRGSAACKKKTRECSSVSIR